MTGVIVDSSPLQFFTIFREYIDKHRKFFTDICNFLNTVSNPLESLPQLLIGNFYRNYNRMIVYRV